MLFNDICYHVEAPRMEKSCGGLCMEMTFPLNNIVQIVRGCYEDFFSGVAPTVAEGCEFSIGNATTALQFSTIETPITSASFCDWKTGANGGLPCNVRYYTGYQPGEVRTLGGDRAMTQAICEKEVRGTGVTCKSCVKIGANGECSGKTSSTCTEGRYCVKIKGTAGKTQVEMRGCSAVSPYPKSGSYCTRISSEMTDNVFMGVLKGFETMNADICICNDGDNCNAASEVTYLLIPMFFAQISFKKKMLRLGIFAAFAFTTTVSAVAPIYCNQCATTALRDRWYVTGLPNYPTSLSFTDECMYNNEDFTSGNSSRASCPTCFELTFPLDGAQQMVRGCWRDFLVGYEDLTTVANDRCEYSSAATNDGVAVTIGPTKVTTTTPMTVFYTCLAGKADGNPNYPCNSMFGISQTGGNYGPLTGEADKMTCTPAKEIATGKECYSCSHFGNEGSCPRKSKTTCRVGAFCTKLQGKLGKNDIVIRGCAALNPFSGSDANKDTCIGVEGQFSLPGLYASGPKYTFHKNTKLCICNGDKCNPATRQSSLLAAAFALFAMTPFLL
ncbi:unnamed protein product, partial [Mesorhabditis spiculigera]